MVQMNNYTRRFGSNNIVPEKCEIDIVLNKNSDKKDERDAYRANSVQDLDGDGKITKKELVDHIRLAK